MKCITCGGKTEEKRIEYAELGVSFGKYKAQVCLKCDESYFDEATAAKIQQKSKELGLFGMARKTKVAEVGNSLAIRIPKDIADFLGLKKGHEILLQPKDKHDLRIQV